MVDRRSLLNGTLFSGLAALSPAQQSRTSTQDDRDELAVARAIDNLNATVQHAVQTSPELARIRDQQRVFLKANQKYPDFLEVDAESGKTNAQRLLDAFELRETSVDIHLNECSEL